MELILFKFQPERSNIVRFKKKIKDVDETLASYKAKEREDGEIYADINWNKLALSHGIKSRTYQKQQASNPLETALETDAITNQKKLSAKLLVLFYFGEKVI